jgi:hypothetical protein
MPISVSASAPIDISYPVAILISSPTVSPVYAISIKHETVSFT